CEPPPPHGTERALPGPGNRHPRDTAAVAKGPVPPIREGDHIIWSLCCFLYSNPLCLGLAALIFSIKSRDRKVVGDLEGARHYGATARCLNIASRSCYLIFVFQIYECFGFSHKH
uniref:Uncharacterized protein n=1 Tax=Oryzias latipes TaxID=8090 RepID=A0A3P9I233_ORYLA